MVTRSLFVEGGGDQRILEDECRKGFRIFLEKAGCSGRMPRIIACGGRSKAMDSFQTALRGKKDGDKVHLLVDSECAVDAAHTANQKPWDHLAQASAGGFAKPDGATDCDAHLMVECMESWFLADLPGLQKGLGKVYARITVPHGGGNVELLTKAQVMELMERAASGRYSKGGQSFKILAQLDPSQVENKSVWAKRFLDEMRK